MIKASDRKAFIFRISGSRGCKLKIALHENEIMIPFSKIKGLLEPKLTKEEMRKRVHKKYYKKEKNIKKSEKATNQIWCFLNEIDIGNYIIIPKGKKFYIGKITGKPYFDENRVTVNAAYRREVEWLNYKIPIPLNRASKALQKQIRSTKKCFEISELVEDVIYSMRTLK